MKTNTFQRRQKYLRPRGRITGKSATANGRAQPRQRYK